MDSEEFLKKGHSVGTTNAWYPKHVSDRVDSLIDELSEDHLRQLFDALKSKTMLEWLYWLEDARDDISKYDRLSPAQRKRGLHNPSPETLSLHHACVFTELWRARLQSKYFPLPPYGMPIDTPEAQREMMLAVLASYSAAETCDLWPFELPEGEDHLPFKSSNEPGKDSPR